VTESMLTGCEVGLRNSYRERSLLLDRNEREGW